MGSKTLKIVVLSASILFGAFVTKQIIISLSYLPTTVTPEVHLIRAALALAGFAFSIVGSWIAFRLWGGALITLFAVAMTFFVSTVSASSIYLWFLLFYSTICFTLYRLDLEYENMIAGNSVDFEKYQNERNALETSYKIKGEGISILFEKYSTYYNLRKLAEELSTSLQVAEISKMVVHRGLDFIPRGEIALLSIARPDGRELEILAYARPPAYQDTAKPKDLAPDLFDHWVIKSRRRLVVIDTLEDFRFDPNEVQKNKHIRSLIIAPLFHEGRVMGTLRIHSAKPETFTHDDLRLLDTIAILASSALSNARLYEQTEELAIRDSLTGLYVRRYFFDRLKEEHRRALITKRPLSVIMSDLDHFKECNDRFGHGGGDLILIQLAQILIQNLQNAVIARYGGEEFAFILPETSKKEALQIAENLRQKVEKHHFSIRRELLNLTLSLGVASMPEDALDMETLLLKADQHLYSAKRSGRNRVCSNEAQALS